VLGLAVAPAVQAVDFEITPYLGYRFGGQFQDPATQDNVDVDPDMSYGIAFDVVYTADKAIQVFYGRQSSQMEDSVDMTVEYMHIGGVAWFPIETHTDFVPFAVGTIGATRFSPSGNFDDETRFSLSLGGGWQYFFSPNLGLRFEGRGYATVLNSNTDLFCVSNGGATCLFRSTGSLFWQIEASAGFTFKF
jgi:hypothetical protein